MKGKQELNPLMGQRLAFTLARLYRIDLFLCLSPYLISRSVEARVSDLDAIVWRGLSGKKEL